KSLKTGGLARYLAGKGVTRFLVAKVNEAEVLADAGIKDILVANQIIGPRKLKRLCELARRADVKVCVDDPGNVAEMGRIARDAGVTLSVLVEVDIGMGRCGVPPGEPALSLARRILDQPALKFAGLQGYDGHLQMVPDPAEQRKRSLEATEQLVGTRRLLEKNGIPVGMVTGAGTGTCQIVGKSEGITEIHPGSCRLLEADYRAFRSESACVLVDLRPVLCC